MTEVATLFREHVFAYFRAACLAFEADPGDKQWLNLKAAMWAWQHVGHMSAEQLNEAAIERLFDLAERAKGDRDFGEA